MSDIVSGVDPARIASDIEANTNDYLLSFACLPSAELHGGRRSSESIPGSRTLPSTPWCTPTSPRMRLMRGSTMSWPTSTMTRIMLKRLARA